MLFNSVEFLFLFFPLTVLGYFYTVKFLNVERGLTFLILASLLFYGYWNPKYLLLIGVSVSVNFFIGRMLSAEKTKSKALLVAGIGFNLVLLGYFKYANFFLESISAVIGEEWSVINVVLPLAISFFTFQQISFLIDAWRGLTKEYSFNHYCLFVTFFPQLIAGPIVHHKEMLPQFFQRDNLHPIIENFAIGIAIFAIGLFKKTVIADNLSPYVGPVFDSQDGAMAADLVRSWIATLCYTFQLYFDFSGYSDMAIGLARIFGIRLPINFYSPYKATNIVDFWRRWHITLSRFLRDYLYIGLGGNRKGTINRYRNLLLTMVLGGLWHGAGWTFVVWGFMHGIFLVINYSWISLTSDRLFNIRKSYLYKLLCWLLTFFAVMLSWVYFRAVDIQTANQIITNLFGFNGINLPAGIVNRLPALQSVVEVLGVSVTNGGGSEFVNSILIILVVSPIAFVMPNIAQIFRNYRPVLSEPGGIIENSLLIKSRNPLVFTTNKKWAFIVAFFIVFSCLTFGQVSEFLYFQF